MDDPISGGRHKVFGNRRLGVIPQTSTIGSHLPRAVGLAFALERRQRLGLDAGAPSADAIVVAELRRRVGQPLDDRRRLNAAGLTRVIAA